MRWLLAIWVYLAAAASVVMGALVAFVPYGSLLGGMILILQGIGLATGFSLYLKESAPRRLTPGVSDPLRYAPVRVASRTGTGVSPPGSARPRRSEVPDGRPDSDRHGGVNQDRPAGVLLLDGADAVLERTAENGRTSPVRGTVSAKARAHRREPDEAAVSASGRHLVTA